MDQPIWVKYKLTEELWREIIVRREVKILSAGNFIGYENPSKATETYTGEDIRQVRGVGIIIQATDKTRVLIPWVRVISFTYHNRDPLMYLPGAGS